MDKRTKKQTTVLDISSTIVCGIQFFILPPLGHERYNTIFFEKKSSGNFKKNSQKFCAGAILKENKWYQVFFMEMLNLF
jgi:hypothetical protein